MGVLAQSHILESFAEDTDKSPLDDGIHTPEVITEALKAIREETRHFETFIFQAEF